MFEGLITDHQDGNVSGLIKLQQEEGGGGRSRNQGNINKDNVLLKKCLV